ncbi:unnamed protein product [Closterium sp. Naga37s-1]|nr:unnamed protein product [Closterium sp. Naga37s-1]
MGRAEGRFTEAVTVDSRADWGGHGGWVVEVVDSGKGGAGGSIEGCCVKEELPPWVVGEEEEQPCSALAHPHLLPLHQAQGEGGAAPAATPLGGAEGEEEAWRNPGQVGDTRGEGRQEWGSGEGEGSPPLVLRPEGKGADSLPLVLRPEGEGADILPLVLRRGEEGGDIPFLVLPHGGAGDHSPPLVLRHGGEGGACEAGGHSAGEGAGAGFAASAGGEEVASGGGGTVGMEVGGASGEWGSTGEQGMRPHRHRMGEEGGGKEKVQAGLQGEQERCTGEEGEGRQQQGWKMEVGERGEEEGERRGELQQTWCAGDGAWWTGCWLPAVALKKGERAGTRGAEGDG